MPTSTCSGLSDTAFATLLFESRKVTFTIPASDLAFVGYDGRWVLEKGDFDFTVGTLKARTKCTETKKWTTPNI